MIVWWISSPVATFALFESDGRVVDSAPYGKRLRGLPIERALATCRARGADRVEWWPCGS